MQLVISIHIKQFLFILVIQVFPFLTLRFAQLSSLRGPQLTNDAVQELYICLGAALFELISPLGGIVMYYFLLLWLMMICLGAFLAELFRWRQVCAPVLAFRRFTTRAVLAESVLIRLVLEITVLHLGELLLMCYFLLAFGLNALVF